MNALPNVMQTARVRRALNSRRLDDLCGFQRDRNWSLSSPTLARLFSGGRLGEVARLDGAQLRRVEMAAHRRADVVGRQAHDPVLQLVVPRQRAVVVVACPEQLRE